MRGGETEGYGCTCGCGCDCDCDTCFMLYIANYFISPSPFSLPSFLLPLYVSSHPPIPTSPTHPPHRHLLWASEGSSPDLGGAEQDQHHHGVWSDALSEPVVNKPGAYR